ncbi:MAG: MmgE/PrpD family protein [Bradyrhizobium sp.]
MLLAYGELRPVRGADLLMAFVLGNEVQARIGNAISPSHYNRGWHITSTCGVFGAASGAGKLAALDARQMVSALGTAAPPKPRVFASVSAPRRKARASAMRRAMACGRRCWRRRDLTDRRSRSPACRDFIAR